MKTEQLAAVRQAAERVKEWEPWQQESVKCADYILASIPERPEAEITADWLRECWGWYNTEIDAYEHRSVGGIVVYDKGQWQWWYPHDCYVVLKDRHHASMLFTSLGIEPKKGEGV